MYALMDVMVPIKEKTMKTVIALAMVAITLSGCIAVPVYYPAHSHYYSERYHYRD